MLYAKWKFYQNSRDSDFKFLISGDFVKLLNFFIVIIIIVII